MTAGVDWCCGAGVKIVGGCGECLFPRAGVVRPRVRRIDWFLFISTGKSGLILDFIRLLLFLFNVKVYVICYSGGLLQHTCRMYTSVVLFRTACE